MVATKIPAQFKAQYERLYEIQMELHKMRKWEYYPDKTKMEKLEAEEKEIMKNKELIKALTNAFESRD